MAQPGRAKAGTKGRHLASINFTEEQIQYLDGLAEDLGMTRTTVVCLIISDFQKSGKTIRFEVVEPSSERR